MKVTHHVWLFATPWTANHGILQARILEWVAYPFSRGSSQPRDWTQVSCIAGGFFTSWVTGKPENTGVGSLSLLQVGLPNPGIKLESPALQKDSLPAELPGKALQLTSYSNLNGRSSPWYWRDSTYSFFLWDGQNLLFDVSQLPSPASIMTSWCFLLLSSQIPKES